MIHFEGDRSFPLAPEDVAARLGNAAFLVGCLENVDEVVEGALGVLEEVEQRQDELAVLGQQVSVTAAREQRKTVTLMFCDVTGSTALGGRHRLLSTAAGLQLLLQLEDVAHLIQRHPGGSVPASSPRR